MDITAFLKGRRSSGNAMSYAAKELRDHIESRWRATYHTNQIRADIRDGAYANGAVDIKDDIANSYTLSGNILRRRVESQLTNREFVANGLIGDFPNITGSLVGLLGWCSMPNTTRDKVLALIDEAVRTGQMDEHDAVIEKLHV